MRNLSENLSFKENTEFGYGPVYDKCIGIAFLILFIIGNIVILSMIFMGLESEKRTSMNASVKGLCL